MVIQAKQVFLIQCGPGWKGRYRAICRNNDVGFWMYLGKDATRIQEIASLAGPGTTRIETGEELQSTARACRQDYIDFIGQCSAGNRSIDWFRTSFAEKNPFVSDFFLLLCYLRVACTMISRHEGNICIFCDSLSLMESIRTNLGQRPDGAPAVSFYPARSAAERLLAPLVSPKNRIIFLFRYVSRVLLARFIGLIRPHAPSTPHGRRIVAIHSWADHRSFPGGSRYLDVYFGNLGGICIQNGIEPLYIVHVLPTLWYPRALKSLWPATVRWMLFEEFLGIADIFRAAFRRSCIQGYPGSVPRMCGCDVSALVRDEARRDCSGPRSIQSCLWYDAARSLGSSLDLAALFYTFENHIWEKMFVLGFRRFSSRTTLIGYAHATVNPMELSYSHAHCEQPSHPLPDRIAVNGIRARDTLTASGFPADRIVVVGTLRYANAMNIQKPDTSGPGKRILLILSADFHKSVEMALLARSAFAPLTDTEVIIKPHPTMKKAVLDSCLTELPAHFSVTTMPLSDCLGTVDLVIYNDSSAAVEVAMNDIPLIHLKSGHTIDINIFEGVAAVPSVSSPDQLRRTCREILKDPHRDTAEVHRYADQFFAPVDPGAILSLISRP